MGIANPREERDSKYLSQKDTEKRDSSTGTMTKNINFEHKPVFS